MERKTVTEKEIQEHWSEDAGEYYREKQRFLEKHSMASIIADLHGNLVGATYHFGPYYVFKQQESEG